MKKKIQKKFFGFEKITSESVALNCLYQEQNTCHRDSVCEETVLRFCILTTETFCQTSDFPVINKYGKRGVSQI